LSPQETTAASLRINLNSADTTGTKFNASVQVYDSLGVAHTLNLSFEKTGDLAYSVTSDLDGKAATLDNSTLTFDANGNLTDPTSISVTPDASGLNGATLNGISLNLFETNADGSQGAPLITNFAATSNVSATSQDGFAPGTIAGLSVDPAGTLVASFSNGQTRPIAQMALATFNSQDGLSRVGNNLFVETAGSGPASVGRPGSGGRGSIAGNALEESNVDIATEFTNLIVAQRSFQSNSKVITTVNQTLQDLLQII
jgi:flagellar hook protein FlgE